MATGVATNCASPPDESQIPRATFRTFNMLQAAFGLGHTAESGDAQYCKQKLIDAGWNKKTAQNYINEGKVMFDTDTNSCVLDNIDTKQLGQLTQSVGQLAQIPNDPNVLREMQDEKSPNPNKIKILSPDEKTVQDYLLPGNNPPQAVPITAWNHGTVYCEDPLYVQPPVDPQNATSTQFVVKSDHPQLVLESIDDEDTCTAREKDAQEWAGKSVWNKGDNTCTLIPKVDVKDRHPGGVNVTFEDYPNAGQSTTMYLPPNGSGTLEEAWRNAMTPGNKKPFSTYGAVTTVPWSYVKPQSVLSFQQRLDVTPEGPNNSTVQEGDAGSTQALFKIKGTFYQPVLADEGQCSADDMSPGGFFTWNGDCVCYDNYEKKNGKCEPRTIDGTLHPIAKCPTSDKADPQDQLNSAQKTLSHFQNKANNRFAAPPATRTYACMYEDMPSTLREDAYDFVTEDAQYQGSPLVKDMFFSKNSKGLVGATGGVLPLQAPPGLLFPTVADESTHDAFAAKQTTKKLPTKNIDFLTAGLQPVSEKHFTERPSYIHELTLDAKRFMVAALEKLHGIVPQDKWFLYDPASGEHVHANTNLLKSGSNVPLLRMGVTDSVVQRIAAIPDPHQRNIALTALNTLLTWSVAAPFAKQSVLHTFPTEMHARRELNYLHSLNIDPPHVLLALKDASPEHIVKKPSQVFNDVIVQDEAAHGAQTLRAAPLHRDYALVIHMATPPADFPEDEVLVRLYAGTSAFSPDVYSLLSINSDEYYDVTLRRDNNEGAWSSSIVLLNNVRDLDAWPFVVLTVPQHPHLVPSIAAVPIPDSKEASFALSIGPVHVDEGSRSKTHGIFAGRVHSHTTQGAPRNPVVRLLPMPDAYRALTLEEDMDTHVVTRQQNQYLFSDRLGGLEHGQLVQVLAPTFHVSDRDAVPLLPPQLARESQFPKVENTDSGNDIGYLAVLHAFENAEKSPQKNWSMLVFKSICDQMQAAMRALQTASGVGKQEMYLDTLQAIENALSIETKFSNKLFYIETFQGKHMGPEEVAMEIAATYKPILNALLHPFLESFTSFLAKSGEMHTNRLQNLSADIAQSQMQQSVQSLGSNELIECAFVNQAHGLMKLINSSDNPVYHILCVYNHLKSGGVSPNDAERHQSSPTFVQALVQELYQLYNSTYFTWWDALEIEKAKDQTQVGVIYKNDFVTAKNAYKMSAGSSTRVFDQLPAEATFASFPGETIGAASVVRLGAPMDSGPCVTNSQVYVGERATSRFLRGDGNHCSQKPCVPNWKFCASDPNDPTKPQDESTCPKFSCNLSQLQCDPRNALSMPSPASECKEINGSYAQLWQCRQSPDNYLCGLTSGTYSDIAPYSGNSYFSFKTNKCVCPSPGNTLKDVYKSTAQGPFARCTLMPRFLGVKSLTRESDGTCDSRRKYVSSDITNDDSKADQDLIKLKEYNDYVTNKTDKPPDFCILGQACSKTDHLMSSCKVKHEEVSDPYKCKQAYDCKYSAVIPVTDDGDSTACLFLGPIRNQALSMTGTDNEQTMIVSKHDGKNWCHALSDGARSDIADMKGPDGTIKAT